ncbi:chloroplast RelA-like protein [Corchorus olitorius]|uniref:Chloroplast RelA-like protein n=1 Tax=Corchorus olitorius TaxID=93759 RepID=A0A1R3J3C9_9ROSI|nr:chloroplast RelA-like protein [Corchorus olitorius]
MELRRCRKLLLNATNPTPVVFLQDRASKTPSPAIPELKTPFQIRSVVCAATVWQCVFAGDEMAPVNSPCSCAELAWTNQKVSKPREPITHRQQLR